MKHLLAFLVLVTSFAVHPTSAQEVMLGKGVVCNTQAQIEEFAKRGARPEDMVAVNEKAKDSVCGFGFIAYEAPENIGQPIPMNSTLSAQVAKITVVGYNDGHEWHKLDPIERFIVFPVNGANI